jgi:hypothetical protein
MTAVIAAMADCLSLVPDLIAVITGNPVLLFFLAASLVPVGFGIFRAAKRAARH